MAAGPQPQIELTTAWGVNAAYEHFWNTQWRTSLYGGYGEVSYNGQANAMLCSAHGSGIGTTGGTCRGQRWLRQQLVDLVGRFAHPVERHPTSTSVSMCCTLR